jgi:leucyl-tRNA synthetase
MVDFSEVCRRWQKRWESEKAFEAVPDPKKPKFFITFPYPYVNGYLHLGHLYTLMRCEAMARYKRMRGYNVLFPQAWHATGSPIEAAAKRVAEQEPKELKILKDMGFADKDLLKFSDPLHWIKTFTKACEEDYRTLGMSVDWRRNFVTTDLNPRYSKFVQWQFRKLKDGGQVIKGSYPVVWCPKEQLVVQDHGRSQGEGVMPEEMVLIKFTRGKLVLPAATFRPETVYGVTNLWLNPELTYVEADVDGERWLISEPAAEKLADQKRKVKVVKKVKGSELISTTCRNPVTKKEVPILPASFVAPDIGTGVVMSVPSHAPYDYIALADLQAKPPKTVKAELIKAIQPVSLIAVPGYGEHPAIEACKRMGIRSQADVEKLEEATNEVYKKEFHTGRLKENTSAYKGLTIQEAKPRIIADFQKAGTAALMQELARPVICRCLARCHAKVVDNQWFIRYGDEQWKSKVGEALAQLKLYPEKAREHFLHTLGWLRDWPCARASGLGTRLPWDEQWVIEALSDSTLYPAYYTISHLLEKVPAQKLTDALFDYVFLGKGAAKDTGIDMKLADQMRQEFAYWYPCDFRNSGKDLVQNHLTFYLFNHVAILPQKCWPAGIGVNGWINVDGQKMSKSKGNFLMMRDAYRRYGIDQARLTVLLGGEGLDDTNFEIALAESMTGKLEQWYAFALEHHGKGSDERGVIDSWMESQLNAAIRDATAAMDESRFRTALLRGFLDLQRQLKWYIRRKAGNLNKAVLTAVIEAQTRMLAPFAPHLAEEIWFKTGRNALLSTDSWPAFQESKINPSLDAIEGLVATALEDIHTVLKLAKLEKPKQVTLFVAEDWKHDLVKRVRELLLQTRNPGDIIKACLAESTLKQHAKDVPALVQRLVKDPSKMPTHILHQEGEAGVLREAVPFFSQEIGCPVSIIFADASRESKARQAMPGKPAILAA